MDHYSGELMNDDYLEVKRGKNTNAPPSKTAVSRVSKAPEKKLGPGPRLYSNLKVEMPILWIADESEKQLYETLKHVYGSNFKINDPSEFQNKKSNLGRQYWLERGNLVIKGVVDYSSKDTNPKSHDQLTKQFATSKLESYSFHGSHCNEALTYTNGHVGKALEILFEKYYGVKDYDEASGLENLDSNELLERRSDEKLALESIYGDMFVEKIKNQIWLIKLKLNYLLDDSNEEKTEEKPKVQSKDICRLFQHGKCRFGTKCRFLHQQPSVARSVVRSAVTHDAYYTLEIRFPEDYTQKALFNAYDGGEKRPIFDEQEGNFHFFSRSSNNQPLSLLVAGIEIWPLFSIVKEKITYATGEGCKYPYEPPYLYFYKNEMIYPSLEYLMIVRRLYDEALDLCTSGTPSLFSIVSLLENECELKSYLQENEPQFPDRNDSLFPKLSDGMSLESLASHYRMGSTNRSGKGQVPWEEIVIQDDKIREKFFEKQQVPVYKSMKESRRKLPAWHMMNEILEIVEQNQVTIVSGETGCGKSTQVPQFLLDNWLVNRSEETKEHVEIICTQPRRISAIGVAERVAAERAERIGNTVGYQIRLESKMSSWTRLTFCTTGILLQRMSSDPHLKSISHIIVDEVHERSAESDFLLMLLKELIPKRPELKVILMSATLKTDAFSSYFMGSPVLDIPGRTFPVEQIFLEDVFETTNYVLEENVKYTRRIKGGWEKLQIELEAADIESLSAVKPKHTILDESLTLAQIIGRYAGYSRQTYKNLYVMDPEKINNELIEKVLEWIVDGHHDYPREGSILVFLPGIAEITAVRDCLNDNKILSPRSGRFQIIPLHSTLSSEEQNLIFKKTKEGVRKIVLSTNLAETSVTIDDCVFVVDTGKMKETRFNSNQNMASLETCWVSRANALQRKGRAGRVMPGISIHLYTSHRFKYHFLAQPIPEILRIPLEPLLLRIQIMHMGKQADLHGVLERLLEPPSRQSISDALKRLQDVGAFDSAYSLTPLGHHLGALPVDVRIGKLILYGAIFCCVDSALTIAACLSHKSPFASPFDKRREVDAKRKEFTTAQSDQLTILKAYKKWSEACSHSTYAGQVFANENFLSQRTLHVLADIKHQLLELLVSIGFVPVNMPRRQMGVDRVLEITGPDLNGNNDNYKLLQGLLCAALYPNVVKIFAPEKSFQMQSSGAIPRHPKPEELKFQTKEDGYVNLHPSSVNFSVGYFPSPYLVYQEKVKTSKIFIREISMVSMLPLVLFSGYGLNIEQHNGTFILSLADGWIMLAVESHTVAQLLQHMRIELVKILELKMQDPLLNLLNHQNGRKIIKTIVDVLERD